MYVTYEYYLNSYGGEVPEKDFSKYEKRAGKELDYYTVDRIPLVDNTQTLSKVEYCMCEIIDLFYEVDQQKKLSKDNQKKQSDGEAVSSETVGKQSVSYQKFDVKSVKEIEEELKGQIYNVIRKRLAFTGLLYRGINVR